MLDNSEIDEEERKLIFKLSREADLEIENEEDYYKTIFSDWFKRELEKELHQKNENYFVCISECKDKRIDDFYNFSKEKYTTKLILENDSKVGKYTKYEKVFFISK